MILKQKKRLEHDLGIIKEIAKAICGQDSDFKVEKAVRLQGTGVSSVNGSTRPRLLLVRFEKKEHAELVLKNRFGLKDAGYPNKYINRDLTKEQREHEWKLRQELKEKGRDTHMIFRGKVVARNK